MNANNPFRALSEADANVNYEEQEAREWRQQPSVRNSRIETRNEGTPDEVWLIPPNVRPLEIIGEKEYNRKRIESATNTHMKHNNKTSQIEMWGRREDLVQALKQWENLAENILTEKEKSKKKVRGWAKPDKALTEKQLRKQQRKVARENEEKDYRGFPPESKPFYGVFLFPNSKIPVRMIIGEKNKTLDPIRAQTKCYIWDHLNHIKIAGNTLESVEDATMRIKNLYIKADALRGIPQHQQDQIVKNKYKGWIYHLVEEPKFPYLVKISEKPSWLSAPYDTKGVKIFEPVIDGDPEELNLNDETTYNVNILEEIRNSNPITIENALKEALGTVHLFDEEIKMRVRFGHVCLTDFPKEPLWTFEKLHNKVLLDSRLRSKFSTCITKDFEAIQKFCAVLDGKDEDAKEDVRNNQWDNSPIQEFKVCANRAPLEREGPNWVCSFDVQFKDDGKIGLWSAVTDDKNVMEINMICLDNDYSWRLAIGTAKHLSNDKFSPQGIFVYKLRLSPHNRLIYTNTDNVQVTSICQKTKWKYWWGEHYVVEVTRYEYWKCSKFASMPAGVEVIMDREDPASVTYGVTFYKKSWDDDFAFNTALNIGETPEWHPNDIIYDQKIDGIKGLIEEIRNFLDQLQANIPPVRTHPNANNMK